MKRTEISEAVIASLHRGVVIPALPLALNSKRKLDERRQRALFRYYLDAGAGGIAVAVHTTQFAIRLPEVDLFKPLLDIANEEFNRYSMSSERPIIRIAGVVGKTRQALKESNLALDCGFHAALLSLAAFPHESNEALLDHCRAVAEIIPVIGFYLQTAVGGRVLDTDFWREFSKIDNVIAIKIAPFNRYQSLNVVRGVVESGRADNIALYTGNDDNFVIDLLSEYHISFGGKEIKKRIMGGLLGHWAVWTHSAVKLLERIHNGEFENNTLETLSLGIRITDSNSAFFDAANNFKGCIVGLHEVLRRQGLMEGLWTLDKNEKLSPRQKEEIDRVYAAYPDLNDDAFIAENLARWLS